MIIKNIIEHNIYKILFGLTIIFLGWFSEMSIINYVNSNTLTYLIPYILLVLLLIYISITTSKISKTWIKVSIIFFIAFIIRLFIILNFKAIPFSDFAVYLESANDLVKGNIAKVANDTYYKNFPELLGFIAWDAVLIKIFGYHLTLLRIVNSFISSLICVVIYFIGRKFNDKIGIFAALMYSLYPSQIVMTSVFTNQHLSTFLYLVAILIIQYKLIDESNINKNIIWSTITGLIIGLANIIRPIAPPIILAIIFYFIFKLTKVINKHNIVKLIIILLIPLMHFIVGKVFYYGLYNYNLIDDVNASGDIRYKITVGLNSDSRGQYSNEIGNKFFNISENEKQQMFKQKIIENIKNPLILFNLIGEKMQILFSIPDSSYYWLTGQNKSELNSIIQNYPDSEYEKQHLINIEEYEKIYNSLEICFNMIIYIFATIGLYLIYKSNKKEFIKLFVWIFLGYVGAHCFIEIQPRYRYFLMPIIIVFASYGIINTYDYIFNKYNRKIIK